ncbi:hypothetical protein D3C74_339740 [compost metagenome]
MRGVVGEHGPGEDHGVLRPPDGATVVGCEGRGLGGERRAPHRQPCRTARPDQESCQAHDAGDHDAQERGEASRGQVGERGCSRQARARGEDDDRGAGCARAQELAQRGHAAGEQRDDPERHRGGGARGRDRGREQDRADHGRADQREQRGATAVRVEPAVERGQGAEGREAREVLMTARRGEDERERDARPAPQGCREGRVDRGEAQGGPQVRGVEDLARGGADGGALVG